MIKYGIILILISYHIIYDMILSHLMFCQIVLYIYILYTFALFPLRWGGITCQQKREHWSPDQAA